MVEGGEEGGGWTGAERKETAAVEREVLEEKVVVGAVVDLGAGGAERARRESKDSFLTGEVSSMSMIEASEGDGGVGTGEEGASAKGVREAAVSSGLWEGGGWEDSLSGVEGGVLARIEGNGSSESDLPCLGGWGLGEDLVFDGRVRLSGMVKSVGW